MTQIQTGVSVQELSELQQSAKSQLVRAIAALNQLREQIDAGKVGPKSEANKILGDIRDWLKIAHEVELRLEKYDQDRGGGQHGSALDLDEARFTIGSRLDRLRRAGCPRLVSK
ncbi:hypothetical protein [Planktotalea sp.]|uniref:hypothetical protein n=1 Tax=Planktotalea sp. TaxID=2029877 RepID=UPI003D6AF1A6